MIKLVTFGSVELRGSGVGDAGRLEVQPKRLALLAYLAIQAPGSFCRRDTLLALLWPELDQDRARGALTKATHYLRRTLGDGVLVGRGDDELGVDTDRLWCDAPTFEAALLQGRRSDALELYRGELLAGFFIPGAPDFEKWLEIARARFARDAAQAASDLAAECEAAGDAAMGVFWARRAMVLAPGDESSLRRLIIVLDRTGERAGAVRAYEDFARELAKEYEVAPSAETQALIEAVRRRSTVTNPALTELASPELVSVPTTPGARATETAVPTSSVRGHWRWLLAGALLLTAGGAGYGAMRARGAATALAPQRVVVDRLENRTGDPALDALGSMAADWITQGLSQARVVDVVPVLTALASSRVASRMEQGAESRAWTLARETGAGLVITGAYYLQGDSLYFQAQIADATHSRMLRALAPVAAPSQVPLTAIDRLRRDVMGALAPFLDSRMQAAAAPSSSPPSYEAYRAYAAGLESFISGDMRGAIAQFDRASATDASYTLPRLLAGIAHSNLGQQAAVDSITRIVERSRNQLAPFDRAALDALQAWNRGDRAASYEANARAAALAPGSIANAQLGAEARFLNRPRESVRVLEALDPERGELRGWFPYWKNLAIAHHMLGDYRRELDMIARAEQLHPAEPQIIAIRARALAAMGRVDEVRALLAPMLDGDTDKAPEAYATVLDAAIELRAHGHADDARLLLERAVTRAVAQRNAGKMSPLQRRMLVRLLYAAERWSDARIELAALAATDAGSLTHACGQGRIAAREGDRLRAIAMSDSLGRMTTNYLYGANTWCRAQIASLLGDRREAVTLLRASFASGRAYDLALHLDIDLEFLRDDPAFVELVRPKG